MASTKYKVSQTHTDGKTIVYGNFRAKSPQDAVAAAYEHNKETSFFDFNIPFHVKKGSIEEDVIFNV